MQEAGDGPALDLETLGVDAAAGYEAFETALDDRTGTVAVVAGPYAGRETVLEVAATRTDAERVALAPGDDPPDVPEAGVLVVEGCHHLFERRVGGFDRLDAFVRDVAATDALVVTGWNRYAWGFLSLARDADRAFDTELALPGVEAAGLAALVDREGTPATPVTDTTASIPLFERRETTVGVRDRAMTVPYPWVNPAYLVARQADEDPETAVFERLEAVANGNPGVALAVWERSVREDGTVSPADIANPVESPELTDCEAFCLRIVLSKGRVDREELAWVADADAASFRSLARQGFVERTNGGVRLRPEAVPRAVAVTERRRLA